LSKQGSHKVQIEDHL